MSTFVRFFIGLLLFPVILSAQEVSREFKDRILFMNGREELSTILDTNSSNIQYLRPEIKKDREVSIDKYRIFSITYGSGQEVVFYQQDSINGNMLSVDEMRYFVYGERDALKGFKAPVAFWGGLATGLAGGAAAPAIGLGILAPVIPGVFTAVNASGYVTVRKKNVSDEKYLTNDHFLAGYERTARSIRVQNSLLGGGLGVVLGVGAFFFLIR